MTAVEEALARLREAIDDFGFEAVAEAFAQLDDEDKERSIATLDNGRAWPMAENE